MTVQARHMSRIDSKNCPDTDISRRKTEEKENYVGGGGALFSLVTSQLSGRFTNECAGILVVNRLAQRGMIDLVVQATRWPS